MILTAEQLQDNFNKLISIIDEQISSPRKEKLIAMYREHEERLMLMPASGNINYHNCFVGGYVDHVIRVTECANEVHKLWVRMGSTVNYTVEELIFAAINHDLGKMGSEEAEQYIYNTSEWHRKNQGKLYTNNPTNSFMTVPDRSLKLLNDRQISVTDNEWFGIKLHDGMYEEANKPYYVSYNPESALRTNLPYILHQADMMASRIEKNMADSNSETITQSTPLKKSSLSKTFEKADKDELKNVFDQLFKNEK